MSFRIRYFISGLLVSIFTIIVSNPTFATHRYAIRYLSLTEKNSNITCSAEDINGFIWYVINGQLHRYDGHNSISFTSLYPKETGFSDVKQVVTDNWGRVWLNTDNGFRIFDTNSWQFLLKDPLVNDLRDDEIIAFVKNKKHLYIATQSGKIWQIDKDKSKQLLFFIHDTDKTRTPVGKMLCANDDYLWFAHNYKLYQIGLKNGTTTSFTIPDKLFNGLDDLLALRDGLLLRSYNLGYFTFDGKTLRKGLFSNISHEKTKHWTHFSYIEDDEIVFFFQDGTYTTYLNELSLTAKHSGKHYLPAAIFEGRINQLQYSSQGMLCSSEHGLFLISQSPLNFDYWPYGSARGMIRQHNTYFFGGYGTLKTVNARLPFSPVNEQLPLNDYYSFLQLSPDTSLIALEGDFLAYLTPNGIKSVPYKIAKIYESHFSKMVYCIAPYQGNTFLLGTYNGIWLFDRDTGTVQPIKDNQNQLFSQRQIIRSIRWENERLTYTCNTGYYEFRDNTVHKIYPKDKEKLDIYMHSSRHGKTYLASKGKGLIILDNYTGNTTQYTRQTHGMSSDIIYSMCWFNDILYMGTYSGLCILDEHQRIYSINCNDGLPFEEFNHAATYIDWQRGQLFMGGVSGYLKFDPYDILESVKKRQASTLQLTGMHLTKESKHTLSIFNKAALTDTIYLDSDISSVKLDFAFTGKSDHKSTFRIYPLMHDFQPLPQSGQISIPGLSAGEYRLEIKTMLPNGLSEKTNRWVLYRKSSFYESQLFHVILILSAGGIVFVIIIERDRDQKRENAIKLKLSKDLHDEVGGLLTGISMQADLLNLKPQQPKQSIAVISSYSREAIQTMDDIIWSLDTNNNSEERLEDRIKFYATKMLSPLGVEVLFQITPSTHRTIPQEIRQHLYLIFKEAINNACKHGDASTVVVNLDLRPASIEMKITNNITKIESSPQSGQQVFKRKGQGISNMQRRAETIGALLTCGPNKDKTMFVVHLKVSTIKKSIFNFSKKR